MNLEKAKIKAREIVSKMTAEEKISQLIFNSPAIERLGIHEHNWSNEAAHGVARAGVATVFPQAIGMAATFNQDLVRQIGDTVATEGRAKYNKSVSYDDRSVYKGLTYWAPNINIFRDPRWGRGQETYGEDPFLTATLGGEYIKGLQGDGEYLKAAACAKHFAVHSGPESKRHCFDAKASMKDMWETYLPAFQAAVKNEVAGVMGAYNRTNGEPCCAHTYFIKNVLRDLWKFDGYFVSDCWAVYDISEHHHFTESVKDGAALALRMGCNLNCGVAYRELYDAYDEDLITDDDITEAAVRVFTTRALLGEFEENRPFSDIGYDKLDCEEHRQLNLEAARQSLVLLKNQQDFLPLKNDGFKIAIVGPTANSKTVLEGNYNGLSSQYITIADGIRNEFSNSRIMVANGSVLFDKPNKDDFAEIPNFYLSEGLAAAEEADLTVLCLGLDATLEGEETGLDNDYTNWGDKKCLNLPKSQMALAEAVCDVCENVIVVVTAGSSIDLGEKVRSHAKAIIHAWYPGALGGQAIAEMLGGKFSPNGKLPVTFYYADKALPDFEDYDMKGRTYRFIREEPLYPFGYGLGYSKVEYNELSIVEETEDSVKLKVKVSNLGAYTVQEKVQIYAEFSDSRTLTPNYQLCKIAAVELQPNQSEEVVLSVDKYWIKAVLEDGSRVDPDGKITLYVGGHQPDGRSRELTGDECLKIELN